MSSITLNYNANNPLALRTIEYVLSLGVFTKDTTEQSNYDEIGRLKAEQERLIAEGKMQKPKMIVGFTPQERKMFDNGVDLETVFERIDEKCGV